MISFWLFGMTLDNEEIRKETFSLCPTVQVGLLTKEDSGILQLCYSYPTTDNEFDFINIPSSLITYRKKLGVFDIDSKTLI